MAVPNARHPVGFLDLPGEIKNLVFDIVFDGSIVKLDHKARDRLKHPTPPPPLDLSSTPRKNALLGTCRTIRDEAMPVLAKHTMLDIRHSFVRQDPLRALPPVFLNHVSAITLDLEAFVHINRRLLPSLECVTLVVRVEGITNMMQALHLLHCPGCGGSNAFFLEGMAEVQDWQWLKAQIIHLSAEEHWTFQLNMSWECYAPKESFLVS